MSHRKIRSKKIRRAIARQREHDLFKRIARDTAWTEQDGRCIYCGCPMARAEATAEHRTPQSQGGSHQGWNIAASCVHCNAVKGAMSERDFKAVLNGVAKISTNNQWLARARSRVWARTDIACARILGSVGL